MMRLLTARRFAARIILYSCVDITLAVCFVDKSSAGLACVTILPALLLSVCTPRLDSSNIGYTNPNEVLLSQVCIRLGSKDP